MSEWLDMRRLDGICNALGIRYEDITVESNESAPDGYGYGAWIKDYELGCKVGTGRTPEAAIEDLLDQLGSD
jgi:hypothetical protein